jgi:hypothetical protein
MTIFRFYREFIGGFSPIPECIFSNLPTFKLPFPAGRQKKTQKLKKILDKIELVCLLHDGYMASSLGVKDYGRGGRVRFLVFGRTGVSFSGQNLVSRYKILSLI